MRLHGRREIMAYLGRSSRNKNGWRRTRSRYVLALHYLPGSYRVWTTSEELDALDREGSLTLPEVLASRGAGGEGVREDVGDMSLRSLVGKIYPAVAGKKRA